MTDKKKYYLHNLSYGEYDNLENLLNNYFNWYENYFDKDDKCLKEYSKDLGRLRDTIDRLMDEECAKMDERDEDGTIYFLHNLKSEDYSELEELLTKYVEWYEKYFDEDEECLEEYAVDLEGLYLFINN